MSTRLLGNKHLSGQVIAECSIQTPEGTKVADVAWASEAFIQEWGTVTPFPRAPELGVEIVSPSNSREEMQIKTQLYLEAGAQEVWIVYIDTRLEIFTAAGRMESTQFSAGIKEQLFNRS
ncbi:Putative restriction endonuclease [Thiothrix eikelboomii]|uniref:Putative restriction endonuclease n=1 Tax=Thiothrix eikelboomii TaxID=92487 RepID=A0A1T4X2W8_9GAMM|nr:Uma2 family endonuclease [Thiothrix eikelboomii]SKA83211.1 Putative restriction endonuclease [Thiothrix eikelboomii]